MKHTFAEYDLLPMPEDFIDAYREGIQKASGKIAALFSGEIEVSSLEDNEDAEAAFPEPWGIEQISEDQELIRFVLTVRMDGDLLYAEFLDDFLRIQAVYNGPDVRGRLARSIFTIHLVEVREGLRYLKELSDDG